MIGYGCGMRDFEAGTFDVPGVGIMRVTKHANPDPAGEPRRYTKVKLVDAANAKRIGGLLLWTSGPDAGKVVQTHGALDADALAVAKKTRRAA